MPLWPSSSLVRYLSQIRRVLFQAAVQGQQQQHADAAKLLSSSPTKVTLVMGNPSADLDSFISAVVFSYFSDRALKAKSVSERAYVPLLNLAFVGSSDLWRMRPEFGVAMRLAAAGPEAGQGAGASSVEDKQKDDEEAKGLLGNLVTLNDILESSAANVSGIGRQLHDIFTQGQVQTSGPASDIKKQEIVLTDHNAFAFSLPSPAEQDVSQRLQIVGCIDHHVDESVVPANADPRIINTHIGSCTSLVVKYLRDQGLWPTVSDSDAANKDEAVAEDMQGLLDFATLALAPILIDTSNLHGKGDKCSDTDRDAVAFLESQIRTISNSNLTASTQGDGGQAKEQYDRKTFHDALSTAKTNSLALLSMREIWMRDYKDYSDPTSASSASEGGGKGEVKTGISSLVRPISWLSTHAGSAESFASEIASFAQAEELDAYTLLTRTGDGRKEIGLLTFSESTAHVVRDFEKAGGQELGLKVWDGQDQGQTAQIVEALQTKFGARGEKWQIWWMGNTNMSRKQVAPLLRGVASGHEAAGE